jgi:hypothetical protein
LKNEKEIVSEIKQLHLGIVDNITKQMKRQSISELSKKAYEGAGDVCYAIDKNVDETLDNFFSKFSNIGSTLLISEGIGSRAYGAKPEDCEYVVIVDPIDGTRGLMYDMRSAWVLTGIAPNKDNVSLIDIEIAIQTEIPTTKQNLFDVFVGIKNKGAIAERNNIRVKEFFRENVYEEWKPQPSKARNIEHGFAMLTKFFEGSKTKTAEIEEKLFRRLGLFKEGKALTFDDQYISSGGQFANLISGSYRFCGDLRPFYSKGLCAHPYDVSTKLIATEIGVEITDAHGRDLNVPLDTSTNVAWLGYANKNIRKQVEPILLEILEEKIPGYKIK